MSRLDTIVAGQVTTTPITAQGRPIRRPPPRGHTTRRPPPRGHTTRRPPRPRGHTTRRPPRPRLSRSTRLRRPPSRGRNRTTDLGRGGPAAAGPAGGAGGGCDNGRCPTPLPFWP